MREGKDEEMAECNLVGGPPHDWEPHGPVDAKCRRCGVQQNWHGVLDGLMGRIRTLEVALVAGNRVSTVALEALESIGQNTCGLEPLAAAYARGVLAELADPG